MNKSEQLPFNVNRASLFAEEDHATRSKAQEQLLIQSNQSDSTSAFSHCFLSVRIRSETKNKEQVTPKVRGQVVSGHVVYSQTDQ